jgi:hypothetical protein
MQMGGSGMMIPSARAGEAKKRSERRNKAKKASLAFMGTSVGDWILERIIVSLRFIDA